MGAGYPPAPSPLKKAEPLVSISARLVAPTHPRTQKPRRMRMEQRRNFTGWVFLLPAALLILLMNFWPMIQALVLSFKTGRGTRLNFAQPLWYNYTRLFQDEIFKLTVTNTLIYLVIQVPIMLVLALILANLLNAKDPVSYTHLTL